MIEAFITLYNKNMLYRKKDLINWCPTLHTAISDIEVENVYITERTQLQVPGYEKMITFGEIAHIAYPIKDTSNTHYCKFVILFVLFIFYKNIFFFRR